MRRAGETCVDAEKVKLWGLKGRTGAHAACPSRHKRRSEGTPRAACVFCVPCPGIGVKRPRAARHRAWSAGSAHLVKVVAARLALARQHAGCVHQHQVLQGGVVCKRHLARSKAGPGRPARLRKKRGRRLRRVRPHSGEERARRWWQRRRLCQWSLCGAARTWKPLRKRSPNLARPVKPSPFTWPGRVAIWPSLRRRPAPAAPPSWTMALKQSVVGSGPMRDPS